MTIGLMPMQHSGTLANAVHIPSNEFATGGVSGTIFSGVKFDADGNMYERQAAGGWSNVGSWLLRGTNTTFYISRTEDSGTLTTDAGAGPLQMNADRIYDVQQAIDGEKMANVTFSISDDVSGSPVVATRTLIFTAIRGTL